MARGIAEYSCVMQTRGMASLIGIRDLATIIGAIVALAMLIRAVVEYIHQGAQRRAEHFVNMRRRFKENETFREICSLVENEDQKLESIPYKDKRELVGFFEELALMTNSGLIRHSVAHYMFGYYVVICWQNDSFWQGLDRESAYWALFRDFAVKMQDIEKTFTFDRRNFRF